MVDADRQPREGDHAQQHSQVTADGARPGGGELWVQSQHPLGARSRQSLGSVLVALSAAVLLLAAAAGLLLLIPVLLLAPAAVLLLLIAVLLLVAVLLLTSPAVLLLLIPVLLLVAVLLLTSPAGLLLLIAVLLLVAVLLLTSPAVLLTGTALLAARAPHELLRVDAELLEQSAVLLVVDLVGQLGSRLSRLIASAATLQQADDLILRDLHACSLLG
ncbi:MAG: hypothetical protein JO168_07225 [Solirubrobacterales bacterium]|nr:hypothetical protein [Solirubrobacterales bacterium]